MAHAIERLFATPRMSARLPSNAPAIGAILRYPHQLAPRYPAPGLLRGAHRRRTRGGTVRAGAAQRTARHGGHAADADRRCYPSARRRRPRLATALVAAGTRSQIRRGAPQARCGVVVFTRVRT